MQAVAEQEVRIVAVGASAGGLDALRSFLGAVSVESGFAFLIVQHLDPSQPSQLAAILAKSTRVPVEVAQDGAKIQPNRAYVTPPGSYVSIEGGLLRVVPAPAHEKPSMPIDHVFRSVAKALQEAAIGVVLSGTGTDGTSGLAAIKAGGGLTFAQDLATAEFPAMPQSADEHGCVDLVLPPDRIARRLPLTASRMAGGKRGSAVADGDQAEFHAILAIVASGSGLDFAQYRPRTLRRRIDRRAALGGKANLTEYAEWLKQDPAETQALFNDLLIHVTRFFRDPGVFRFLETEVWPAVLRNKAPGEPIRIWVPGCSTGQEIYSLAMSLMDFTERAGTRPPLQFFGTDAHEETLAKARQGVYDLSVESEVGPDRLQRFFTRQNGNYRVNQSVRNLCTFALHDLTRDTPFSKLDIISCRNLLIYLSPALQKTVLSTFHGALNPKGVLVLGTSETVGESKHFTTVNLTCKVFAKAPLPPNGVALPSAVRNPGVTSLLRSKDLTASDFQREADRIVLSEYGPPGLLVKDNLDIVQFRGQTRRFLDLPSGDAMYNLLKMAPKILGVALREAVGLARTTHEPVETPELEFRVDETLRVVSVRVLPVSPRGSRDPHFLILFREKEPGSPSPLYAARPAPGEPLAEIDLLRRELAAERVTLQEVVREQGAASAELTSTHEEAIATNEELQSTNEELESAKEELHATTEEVTTLNEELREHNTELKTLKEFSEAIVNTVRHPLVVLGGDLRVKSANPAFYRAFNSTPKQTEGRPFCDVGGGPWDVPELRGLLEDVLPREESIEDFAIEARFPKIGQRSIVLNAYRLRSEAGTTHMILLAIEDVTQRKAAASAKEDVDRLRGAVKEAESFSYMVTHDLRTPLRSIVGFSERVLRGSDGLSPESRQALQFVHRYGVEMGRTIEGLLQLSRVSRVGLHREEVDASKLVASIVADLQGEAGRRVDVIVPAGITMHGDPELVRILLTNLLGNAWKFTRAKAQARIEFGVAAVDGRREYFVQDDGIGFPASDSSTLFQPFQRLHSASAYEGTGIGLATVRRIADRHGGKVWAEGSLNKGATIHFTLGEEIAAQATSPATPSSTNGPRPAKDAERGGGLDEIVTPAA